jgi:hypothetical protein
MAAAWGIHRSPHWDLGRFASGQVLILLLLTLVLLLAKRSRGK